MRPIGKLAELHHSLVILEEDDNVRLLVIRGAGNTAFVAGLTFGSLLNFHHRKGQPLPSLGIKKYLTI